MAHAKGKELKSPKHKLISFFHSARDKWRERAMGYRKSLRAAGVTARDLRHSRDAWKQKYARERERRLELESRLEHAPPPAAQPSRLTTTAASDRCR
jgi:hypothetical protein